MFFPARRHSFEQNPAIPHLAKDSKGPRLDGHLLQVADRQLRHSLPLHLSPNPLARITTGGLGRRWKKTEQNSPLVLPKQLSADFGSSGLDTLHPGSFQTNPPRVFTRKKGWIAGLWEQHPSVTWTQRPSFWLNSHDVIQKNYTSLTCLFFADNRITKKCHNQRLACWALGDLPIIKNCCGTWVEVTIPFNYLKPSWMASWDDHPNLLHVDHDSWVDYLPWGRKLLTL